ncbi:MAG: hypothetical protein HZT40_07685 [Candidatus Thiothrix singaporensis]|uniref:Transmembrane protein n=1 Tax=Candidatus Thiothrix singaporensis TaxID=2799669 RepID=A0A7L6AR00_9GAMM|nr:MAG: hypothetical protein HZT40_07685 [Candidatus Thiothrix singaporensis]
MKDLLIEYFRPWKIVLLLVGITLLIGGSYYYQAPDWDIPISFIMAIFAYLTAPWSMRVVLERKWRWLPLVLFYTWFTVDGCYWLYWRSVDPNVLDMMRDANFPASLSLYGMCGLVWYYKGTFKQLLTDIRKLRIET